MVFYKYRGRFAFLLMFVNHGQFKEFKIFLFLNEIWAFFKFFLALLLFGESKIYR